MGYPSCYTPGSFGFVIEIVQFTHVFCAICQMLGNSFDETQVYTRQKSKMNAYFDDASKAVRCITRRITRHGS